MYKQIRTYAAFLLALFIALLPLCPAFCGKANEAWSSFISHGNEDMSEGDFENADRCFLFAIHLAEKNKLSPKHFAIALSAAASVEVLAGHIDKAEGHFQRLVSFDKQLRTDALSDRKLMSFLVSLADNYAGYKDPKVRESCLSHACYLKKLLFGENEEYMKCLSDLGATEIKNGKLTQGIQDLTKAETFKAQKTGANVNDIILCILHQLAIDSKRARNYDQAKELEMRVISIARSGSSSFKTGMPAFYSFLGMNAMAQGRGTEAKGYFARAKKECSTIKDPKRQEMAEKCFGVIVEAAFSDKLENRLVLAESELRQLLEIQQALSSDPLRQYAELSYLAAVLDAEHKFDESIQYINRAIALGNFPNSFVVHELPGLYIRLATSLFAEGQLEKGSEAIARAFELERPKGSFKSTRILFGWGISWKDYQKFSLAEQKLNETLRSACALPPNQRGTLVADAQEALSECERALGKTKEARVLHQQSLDEIRLQRKLGSTLGPDYYKRMLRAQLRREEP